MVFAVEVDGIAGEQPAHGFGEGNRRGHEQQVKVIGKKHPGEAFCGTFRQLGGKSGQKPFLIGIIGENVASFDAANDNMMEDIRNVKTWLAGHGWRVTLAGQDGNN